MFGFKKRREEKIREQKAIYRLERKMDIFQDILLKMTQEGFSCDITIEKIDVNDPVIDNLTFRLDTLDVKDLSGALNLGNNFGVGANPNNNKKGSHKEDGARSKQPKDRKPDRSPSHKTSVTAKKEPNSTKTAPARHTTSPKTKVHSKAKGTDPKRISQQSPKTPEPHGMTTELNKEKRGYTVKFNNHPNKK
ncbi:hypothetical protein EV207_11423 [Scopulibacillus darangshiensis]|uniref:Uncharacterized protein n=1 Tax=Scopulibacillus darangshiensis TaxID=442528 RepID=A0A4R2P4M7_9BACL|nr:hypothetical protein [Scopulibacillus darangshiensis]TCP28901.1 hypothetical protein EV207_11423 [Scopulibacillus darangshiensis]